MSEAETELNARERNLLRAASRKNGRTAAAERFLRERNESFADCLNAKVMRLEGEERKKEEKTRERDDNLLSYSSTGMNEIVARDTNRRGKHVSINVRVCTSGIRRRTSQLHRITTADYQRASVPRTRGRECTWIYALPLPLCPFAILHASFSRRQTASASEFSAEFRYFRGTKLRKAEHKDEASRTSRRVETIAIICDPNEISQHVNQKRISTLYPRLESAAEGMFPRA